MQFQSVNSGSSSWSLAREFKALDRQAVKEKKGFLDEKNCGKITVGNDKINYEVVMADPSSTKSRIGRFLDKHFGEKKTIVLTPSNSKGLPPEIITTRGGFGAFVKLGLKKLKMRHNGSIGKGKVSKWEIGHMFDPSSNKKPKTVNDDALKTDNNHPLTTRTEDNFKKIQQNRPDSQMQNMANVAAQIGQRNSQNQKEQAPKP